MNLIQIQDRLKELPNSPQTMQLLMGYANGQSPVVPPYLALGELQRRNQLMQERSSAPQGTVKDQVEQQASGIASLSQQGQAMAQQPQVQPPAMATPQPQQGPTEPVQAAGGGLLSLLAKAAQARRMASGGVIAFAAGDPVEDDDEDYEEPDDEDEGGGGDEEAAARGGESRGIEDLIRAQTARPGEAMGPMTARDILAEAQRMYEARQGQRPVGQTYLEERKALLARNPELAAALEDRTGEQLARFDEIQALRRAEYEKQRQEAAAAKPSVLQLLGQAALGTRGQFGKSALGALLGGYGQIQSAADARALEQEQALRMREIELQQTRMEMLGKIDEVKRARAEGDITKEMQSRKELEQLKSKYDTASAQMLGRGMSAVGRAAAAETSAASREAAAMTRAAAELEKSKEATRRAKATAAEATRRAKATAAEATRRALSPKGREAFANRVAELRAAGKDEEADRLIESYRKLGGSTASAGEINAQRALLNIRLRELNDILSPKNLDATDEEKAKAKADKQEILDALKELQTSGTRPAAPAALPMPTGAPDKVREQLKTGAVYDTAKGLGRWNGKEFVPVK